MKKEYLAPEILVLNFEAKDIITVSVQENGNGLSAGWDEND